MESGTRIVTGSHNGMSFPYVVANHVNQHRWLVDSLLREEHAAETRFFVWHKPVAFLDPQKEWPGEWLRIGYHNGFGAAFFHDEASPPGEDWAWIALNPEPLVDAPTIFYDVQGPIIFPPASVMPLDRLREVILEWCDTGLRPTGINWLTVNNQMWDLDQDGNVIDTYPGKRRTVHYLVRNRVVREYGWGTGLVGGRSGVQAASPDAGQQDG